MKTLEVSGKTIKIDTEKLSKGLCDLHNQNKDMKTMLAFGMLDAKLCEMFKKNLSQSIKGQYSDLSNELFEQRINTFINECVNEIERGVYSYAKMVV